MPDYHDAAHIASSLGLICAAANIAERSRALHYDHQPDGGYNAGRVDGDFRRLAAALGYSVEKLSKEDATDQAFIHRVMAEAG